MVAWSHDETQTLIRCGEGLEEVAAEIGQRTALEAGEALGVGCPIRADEMKFGRNWADTH